MNRREFLGLAVIPLAQALDGQPIQRAHGAVIGIDGARLDGVDVIKEVVLFDVELNLPAATGLYGEGFQMPAARMMCLVNWDDRPQTHSVRSPAPATVTDYWTDEPLGRRRGVLSIEMAPRSPRLLKGVS